MTWLILAARSAGVWAWVRGAVSGLLCVGTLGWCGEASAQMQEAIAESLFEEGKQLYADGKYQQACEKLAQSHEADPAGGTVLLLAACYEKQGRTASAWAMYSEAMSAARRDGREDRKKWAEEARTLIESRLTYVNIVLSPEVLGLSGLELRLDGFPIPAISDTSVPIDPGPHVLTAVAPGHAPYRQEFVGGEPKQTARVEVVALEPVSPPPPPVVPSSRAGAAKSPPLLPSSLPPPAKPSRSALPILGWVAGGVGLVSVGVGGYFGYRAIKRDQTADDLCGGGSRCEDAEGVSASQDALEKAKLSTIFVGAGAGALLGAAVLFLVAPDTDRTPGVTTSLRSHRGGALVGLRGRY